MHLHTLVEFGNTGTSRPERRGRATYGRSQALQQEGRSSMLKGVGLQNQMRIHAALKRNSTTVSIRPTGRVVRLDTATRYLDRH